MRMDTLLVQETIQYDKQALVGVYEEYSPVLFRYAYRMLGDSDLAEECVAETFSRFLHTMQNGHGPDQNVKAYLYRISHNWITDHYRRKPFEPLDPDSLVDPQDNPSQVVAQRQEQERIRRALLRLPPEHRQVIGLRFLEGWSHKQIADLLGKTVEATRATQHRALAILRRLLIDPEKEDIYDSKK
jgi:RNA polymerase sigma-70 factor (ECF subfamily)